MDINPRLSDKLSVSEQRDEWRKKGGQMMAAGFALQMILAFAVGGARGGTGSLALLGVGYLVGLGVYIYGCMNYARGKGKSMALGLVGLLGIIGLIILLVIKAEPVDDDGVSDTVIKWDDPSGGPTSITVTDRRD